MPHHPSSTHDPVAAAGVAAARADRRAAAAVADFFVADDARLDDRTRLTLWHVLTGLVDAIDLAIRRHAARLLSHAARDADAERLLEAADPVVARIARPGLLPRELMEELIAQVRHDLIADALPIAVAGPEEPGLLIRLTAVPDAVVAAAASALLAAENRRHGGVGDLPAELHHRLAWLVAAAVHERIGVDPAIAKALAEATQRGIAAHDEGERVEAAAARLAIAIDARPAEVPMLLIDTLGDRRLALFVAVLARTLGMDAAQVRALVVEPDDDRLWFALRAAGLDRAQVAQVALALSDADPRRDIDVFADRLDALTAIAPEAARDALVGLTLPVDFRAAIRALATA